MEGHRKFLGEGGTYKPKFYKQSVKLTWNFLGRGVGQGTKQQQQQKLLGGEYGYFSGTAQFMKKLDHYFVDQKMCLVF